jgi:hypothetical protein
LITTLLHFSQRNVVTKQRRDQRFDRSGSEPRRTEKIPRLSGW